ncbi:MAG: glycosyltransferase family 2 protein, partial [Ferruginibacter sp.]|nr:glycosyltransferase family 2 protein [Ferruginibacter sp.]
MAFEKHAPVSVVIPCYRCTSTIRRAILSIAGQTRRPAEIILVDDASPDETLRVLYEIEREYSGWIKVISSKMNLGPAAARNIGWNLASQPFIAFLDSDDAWHPKKIEIQYYYMHKHPRISLSGHSSRLLRNEDNLLNWSLD